MQSSSDFIFPHGVLRSHAVRQTEPAAAVTFWARLVVKSGVLVALGAAPWVGIFWLLGVL